MPKLPISSVANAGKSVYFDGSSAYCLWQHRWWFLLSDFFEYTFCLESLRCCHPQAQWPMSKTSMVIHHVD